MPRIRGVISRLEATHMVCNVPPVPTAITPPPPDPGDLPHHPRPYPRPGRPGERCPRPRLPLALRQGFPATLRVTPDPPPHPPRRMLGGALPRSLPRYARADVG